MNGTGIPWSAALRDAERFLARWRDPATRNAREDLAQEAAWTAMRVAAAVRDPRCLPAVVRTISRRIRHRWLLRERVEREHLWFWLAKRDECEVPPETTVKVLGVAVPTVWLLRRLQLCLERLTPLNRSILTAYYEGACCAELAARFTLTEASVKVRLCRCRRRLRRALEAEVRVAGPLDS